MARIALARHNGKTVCRHIPARIKDLSTKEACLEISNISPGTSHLFFDAQEGSSLVLVLEIDMASDPVLILPARPQWFNSCEPENPYPFVMGISFPDLSSSQKKAIKLCIKRRRQQRLPEE